MKRDFSFYEFVGILVPGVVLLYFANIIASKSAIGALVDVSAIGDSMIFLVVCYGAGHILQALGNVFENIVWAIAGGMPTKWLTHKNRFGKKLLHPVDEEGVSTKLLEQFGHADKDYGRLVYNVLFQSGKTARIDVFNGNYSLFRGLTISLLLLAILSGILLTTPVFWVPLTLTFLAFLRMLRFARLYAVELFTTYLNAQELD